MKNTYIILFLSFLTTVNTFVFAQTVEPGYPAPDLIWTFNSADDGLSKVPDRENPYGNPPRRYDPPAIGEHPHRSTYLVEGAAPVYGVGYDGTDLGAIYMDDIRDSTIHFRSTDEEFDLAYWGLGQTSEQENTFDVDNINAMTISFLVNIPSNIDPDIEYTLLGAYLNESINLWDEEPNYFGLSLIGSKLFFNRYYTFPTDTYSEGLPNIEWTYELWPPSAIDAGNGWYRIVLVFDGLQNYMRIYIDKPDEVRYGNLLARNNKVTFETSTGSSLAWVRGLREGHKALKTFMLGGFAKGFGFDDMRLWAQALSLDQIELMVENEKNEVRPKRRLLLELDNNYDDDSTFNYDCNGVNNPVFDINVKATGTYAMNCSKSNDFVNIISNDNFIHEPFTERTVAFWFKTEDQGDINLFDEGGTGNGLAVRLTNGGSIEAIVKSGDASKTVSGCYLQDVWTHVTVTYDEGRLSIYTNGELVELVTDAPTTIPHHSDGAGFGGTNGVNAFGTSDANQEYIKIWLDDLLIADDAFEYDEIEDLIAQSDIELSPLDPCRNIDDFKMVEMGFDNNLYAYFDDFNEAWGQLPSGTNSLYENFQKTQGTHSYISQHGSYIDLDPNDYFIHDAFSERTIMFWVAGDFLSTSTTIQNIYDEGGAGNGLAIRKNGNSIEVAIRNSSADTPFYTLSHCVRYDDPFENTFFNVAVTFRDGFARLYINGYLTDEVFTDFRNIPHHGSGAGLGGSEASNAFDETHPNFEGLIDHFLLYSKALTKSEILYAMAQADRSGPAYDWEKRDCTASVARLANKKETVLHTDNQETFNQKDFKIYPNPNSTGKFKIDFILSNSAEVKFEMFDLYGRDVLQVNPFTANPGNNTYNLNIPSYVSSGVYIVKVTSKEFEITRKVILK